MNKTLTIDDHVYTQREDGLYEPDEKYAVPDDWIIEEDHDGLLLLTECIDNVQYAKLLANDVAGCKLLRSMHNYTTGGYLLDATSVCNNLTVGYVEV